MHTFKLTIFVIGLAGALHADELPSASDPLIYHGPSKPGDQIWLVNSRNLVNPTHADPGLSFSRFDGRGQFAADQISSLSGRDRNVHTVLYVHGYDFDEQKSQRIGWAMYHVLRQQVLEYKRLRLIVWSWPTKSQGYHMLRDFRAKAKRANAEAYFLAWFMSRVDVDCVIGSALGCRPVTGALHLLAGDKPTLNTVIKAKERSQKLRVVLISAAIDADWLLPGKLHGNALRQAHSLLALNNHSDPMLKRYEMFSNGVALGRHGLDRNDLENLAAPVSFINLDAADVIGEHHGVEHYLRETSLMKAVGSYLLPD